MNDLYMKRFNKLRDYMIKMKIDCIIVCNSPNMYYLTGYAPKLDERMQLIFIPLDSNPLIVVPKLYARDAELYCNIKNRIIWSDGDNLDQLVEDLTKKLNIQSSRIAIDESMRFMHVNPIIKACKEANFISASEIFMYMRMIKDEQEISIMRESSSISDTVMKYAIELLTSGKSELQIKNLIEFEFLKMEMTDGFSNLIAAGPNSSSVHHVSGSYVPKVNDAIYLDIGGAYKKYWSDITRTVHIGKPSDKFVDAYNRVREAQQITKDMIKPGVTANEIHMTAFNYLKKYNLSDLFLHRTGHGMGLEGHEAPSIAKGNEFIIQEGMTFSVEPGVYFNNEFGIRIEDTVVVTKDGCESLNNFTKDLIIL